MRTGGGSSEQPTEIPVHSSNGSGEEPKKKTEVRERGGERGGRKDLLKSQKMENAKPKDRIIWEEKEVGDKKRRQRERQTAGEARGPGNEI